MEAFQSQLLWTTYGNTHISMVNGSLSVKNYIQRVIADIFEGEENQKGLQSFYNLVDATNKWVISKIDELHDLLQKEYLDKDLSAFEKFESLTSQVPTADNIFSKRY